MPEALRCANNTPITQKGVLAMVAKVRQDKGGYYIQFRYQGDREFRGKNQIVKPEIRWLEQNEQWTILERIPLKHRAIFVFISLTGCRPSEARAFRNKDICNNNIFFAVTFGRNKELKEVKGKKIMPFPLTEALKELFESMPKNFMSFVFINPTTGQPYSRYFNKIFNRAASLAGFSKLKLNEFGRKSFAMRALAYMDKGMVSHLLRHQDPRMIDHYAEYQTAPLKSALDKFQNFPLTSPVNSTEKQEKLIC